MAASLIRSRHSWVASYVLAPARNWLSVMPACSGRWADDSVALADLFATQFLRTHCTRTTLLRSAEDLREMSRRVGYDPDTAGVGRSGGLQRSTIRSLPH